MSGLEYKQWLKKYHTEKVVDLKEFFNDNDFVLLKKLVEGIEDKVFTMYEYDQVLFSLFQYYTDDEEQRIFNKEDFPYLKSLEEKNVDREEFNKLLYKVMQIKYPQNIN